MLRFKKKKKDFPIYAGLASLSPNLTQTTADYTGEEKSCELALQEVNVEVTKVSYRECYPMAQQETTIFNHKYLKKQFSQKWQFPL